MLNFYIILHYKTYWQDTKKFVISKVFIVLFYFFMLKV